VQNYSMGLPKLGWIVEKPHAVLSG
jgi:hypothetical protein